MPVLVAFPNPIQGSAPPLRSNGGSSLSGHATTECNTLAAYPEAFLPCFPSYCGVRKVATCITHLDEVAGAVAL